MIDRWINPEGFSRVRAMRFSAKDEIPMACPADYSALALKPDLPRRGGDLGEISCFKVDDVLKRLTAAEREKPLNFLQRLSKFLH